MIGTKKYNIRNIFPNYFQAFDLYSKMVKYSKLQIIKNKHNFSVYFVYFWEEPRIAPLLTSRTFPA